MSTRTRKPVPQALQRRSRKAAQSPGQPGLQKEGRRKNKVKQENRNTGYREGWRKWGGRREGGKEK